MSDSTIVANGDFFRHLQQLTARIHATRNVDEIMLDLSEGICRAGAGRALTGKVSLFPQCK